MQITYLNHNLQMEVLYSVFICRDHDWLRLENSDKK